MPTIDILKTLAARRRRGQIVVGFAAETHNVAVSARRKLKEKKLNWIVANDVSRPGLGMGSEKNAVLLFAREGAPAVIRAGAEIGRGGIHPQARGRQDARLALARTSPPRSDGRSTNRSVA